tara:strand:- start:207 stop:719 length:513 start_codon:yes stop_codon:yes gene_type:complete
MNANNIIFYFIFLFFGILLGCDAENFSTFDTMPPDEDIEILFTNKNDSIKQLVEFCKSNPSVKWLGTESTGIDLSTVLAFKPENTDISEARRAFTDIGGEALMCTRDWSQQDFPLVSVTLPLYSSGLSVSGVSKGIKFIPIVSNNVKARVKSGELKKLGEDGWYIYLSET